MTAYRSTPLLLDHTTQHFLSGKDALDQWLHAHALHAEAMRTARTFVWTDRSGGVVAYFALSAHLVSRAELPPRLARGGPRSIPAILLARLALSSKLHGRGLGGELLWDSLQRACVAGQSVGARLVVVDAIDRNAREFYQHHGFMSLTGHDDKLMQKMSDIAAALGSS